MVPYDELIYSFSEEKVSTRGYIDLHTIFREGSQTKTIPIRFLIVEAPTSYNVLLGRPSLNSLGVVVSTPHLAMKFPSPSITSGSHESAIWQACALNYQSFKPTTLNDHLTST